MLGCILSSIYTAVVLIPSQIGTGGITGIAMCLNALFKWKVGMMVLIANIPLFIIGYKKLGKKFAFRSGVVVIVSSILIDYLGATVHIPPMQDKLITTIFLGVLSGVSMALIFMGGGSGGGTDIIGKVLDNKLERISLSNLFLIQDIIVYCLVAAVFGFSSVMYALIMSFVRGKTIDSIQEGISSTKQCIIICENYEKITKQINEEMNRGVTILEATGGYTNEDKKFLYTVIQTNEFTELKNIVKKLDKNAFITISSVNSVSGNFKERGLTI